MRTTFWNCRGLGIDLTVRRLKEISRRYLPDIICLSETKKQNDYIRDIACNLGFPFYVTVPPIGLSGGLVIFWKYSVEVSVLFQSSNLVHCLMKSNESSFYFSFVYGPPNPSFRNDLWERIERIGITRKNLPWIMMGDFNELLGNNEKRGGRIRPEASFQDFRRMVRTCDFTDLKIIGDRFSWAGRRGDHFVTCCLDRTMANTEWHNIYPSSETEFLELGESDHRPLVTYVSDSVEDRRGSFRYDNRLFHKDGFKDSVLQGWHGGIRSSTEDMRFSERISRCRKKISRWKRNHKTNAEDRIRILRYQLDRAASSGSLTTAERYRLKRELNQAYIDEELFWKLKSGNTWVHEGDRNTKFFHAVTKARKARNKILSIEDKDGVITRGEADIAMVAVDYFQDLYRTSSPPDTLQEEVFQDFPKRVTHEVNTDLTRRVSIEEIKEAVFSIGPHRAPGPDGFSAAFYQQFWSEINPAVVKEVDLFFNEGQLDQLHNHTNLCLIPKIEAPTNMTEFRPIALCNVSYKIISKILVNRLKNHLSSIISDNQAAFIPG